MENDDDFIVLIIGDEYSDVLKQEQIELDEGVFDREKKTENSKHVSKIAREHEEILKLGDGETIIETSYEEGDVKVQLDDIRSKRNENYNFKYDVEEELPEDHEDSSDEEKQTIRRRKLTGYERISYISELKDQYPELKRDNDMLINCLVEVMRALKPPPLPLDYFIMNGIMFQCVKCGVETDSIPAAGRHYIERHGVRYLKCYACGADFRSKTNLYKHERVCSAPDIAVALKARTLFLGRSRRLKPLDSSKPKRVFKKSAAGSFKCTLCSAKFASKRGLQTHKYFHSGERPFLCPQCPNAYTSQTTLARHITHKHGNHYYICDLCQRRFKIKSALAHHMNIHEPIKKHACSECDNRYAAKTSLELHVNRVHRGLPLPLACHLCPKRYPTTSLLKDHMRKLHGLILLTRQGFFQKLPSLSTAQLQQAKVILKKDLDDKNR